METGSGVPLETWPNQPPESGGICIFEGRLQDLTDEVKKQLPIKAVIGSLPRPNQAFWTLSALWAGWLWGREAVEPYKPALRRRRYDWAWNATALNAAFTHLFGWLHLGTPVFGLLSEPEPSSLTSALTAANSAGLDLGSLALRTEHDPVQLLWTCGEHLRRQPNEANVEEVREAIYAHLIERGEPASYLHVHAAGLIALAKSHALKQRDQEFDEALRGTQLLIQNALEEDPRFVHYSNGENVDTGLWGLVLVLRLHRQIAAVPFRAKCMIYLSDRVEIAVVTFLQKNPNSIFLDVEQDLYPRFPGLLTPSKAMIYSVLSSYAQKEKGGMETTCGRCRVCRRNELNNIAGLIDAIGRRLDYATLHAGRTRIYLWEQNGRIERTFYILASALIGRANF